MKTLIIYNDCSSIQYFIVDGDYSRFNNVTFAGYLKDVIEIECNDWMWDINGNILHEMSSDISIVENKQWDKVAMITWIP